MEIDRITLLILLDGARKYANIMTRAYEKTGFSKDGGTISLETTRGVPSGAEGVER